MGVDGCGGWCWAMEAETMGVEGGGGWCWAVEVRTMGIMCGGGWCWAVEAVTMGIVYVGWRPTLTPLMEQHNTHIHREKMLKFKPKLWPIQ